MTGLRVWYGLLSHAAGPERRVILHATTREVAETMAWSSLMGSKQHWDVTVIEAARFEDLK